MKTFSKFEVAAIKRNAKNVAPFLMVKEKLLDKIDALQEQLEENEEKINYYDEITKKITGFSTQELFKRVKVATGKAKDGKPVYATKWELKYPDTVIPPEVKEEPVTEDTLPF